ncbi:MAG: D-glycero-beta-D-manno-heptose 1-phosphate adenylyltransferase [Planctomycetota bacterium]|jgi:D-beta-D-heptose 7-phosphate kinase/D-beta-D-heptose 1-phosphate adenosyltransferase
MYEKLLKTVTNLGSPRILVVGDFMLDIYTYGDALRISPEAPVPVLKVTKTEYSCGGAGSVANDLAVLGAVPYCIGVIGEDNNGQILKEKLTGICANIDGLTTVSERPTISKQRLIGLAQHRHQQQLFRMDNEITEPMSDDVYDEIRLCYKDALKEVDIVCLQDYKKGLLTETLCQDLIDLAKEADKKILIDPPLGEDYSKFQGASIMTPNRQEAGTAVGFDIKTLTDAERAASELVKNLELEAVMITLDKEGAYLKSKETSGIIPTRPRSVYDVTGAGDIVLATLAVTLAAGCDYKTAAQLCNITGGIEVEKFGVATVSIDEIINELVSENRGKKGKIRPIESLIKELDWHRRQGEKIVFTNGCFDVVHRGHIEFLNFCKQQGDVLVVGLNSDSSVKTIKGQDRPINNQHDRASVLAAMESVDYITIFEESEPLNLIQSVKPDILVKGQDWQEKGVVGRGFVESYGGQVVLAPLVEGKSSTTIIEKLKKLWKKK